MTDRLPRFYRGHHVRPSLPVRVVTSPARLVSWCLVHYLGISPGWPR